MRKILVSVLFASSTLGVAAHATVIRGGHDHSNRFDTGRAAGAAPSSDFGHFRQKADRFFNGAGTRDGAMPGSHSLLRTLTFNLGGVDPAAAPAPAAKGAPLPPLPPVPGAAVCNKGQFIVFFGWNTDTISSDAAFVLDNAIRAYGNCGGVDITVSGYTDSSGTPRYNIDLSNRRNNAVQGYLTNHGIAADRIRASAFGVDGQRVPTADGVRELQNRRVEIMVGPGPGY